MFLIIVGRNLRVMIMLKRFVCFNVGDMWSCEESSSVNFFVEVVYVIWVKISVLICKSVCVSYCC